MRARSAFRARPPRQSAWVLLGVLSALGVLVAALSGLQSVQRADRAAELTSQAELYHQNADQAHDALHADVLQLLRPPGAGGPSPAAELQQLHADVTEYRSDVDRVGHLPLPAPLSTALADLRPAQLAYADDAVHLGEQAVSRGAAPPDLDAFQAQFSQLKRAQRKVTEQLAAQSGADARHRRGVRVVLIAGALALAVLVAVSGLLALTGRRTHALLRRERQVAETLQRSMLPDRLPRWPGADLAARFLPCEIGAQVGGDWYDAFVLPDGALALVIGDVTGHDIGAASAMGQLRNALRAWSVIDMAPADVFDRLNDLLFNFGATHMATCVYLRLPPPEAVIPDPSDLVTITVANAGHCPPLVLTPSGRTRLLEDVACLPLGAVPHLRYTQHDYQVERGSYALLYTDGLVERRSRDLDTGLDLLREAAEDAGRGATDPDRLCDAVLARLSGDEPASDDVALLAAKVGVVSAVERVAAAPPRGR
jgi:serine phosphatase RsbU (regulator of sigma subunit)